MTLKVVISISVPFYRFLQNDDPNSAEKKKVWTEKLNGAFTVGVS
jgi:hypothetical protein